MCPADRRLGEISVLTSAFDFEVEALVFTLSFALPLVFGGESSGTFIMTMSSLSIAYGSGTAAALALISSYESIQLPLDFVLAEGLLDALLVFTPIIFAALSFMSSGGGEGRLSRTRDFDEERDPAVLERRVVGLAAFIAEGGAPPNIKLEKLVPRVGFVGRSLVFVFASFSEPEDLDCLSTVRFSSLSFSFGVRVDLDRDRPGGDLSFLTEGGGEKSASSIDLSFVDSFGGAPAPQKPQDDVPARWTVGRSFFDDVPARETVGRSFFDDFLSSGGGVGSFGGSGASISKSRSSSLDFFDLFALVVFVSSLLPFLAFSGDEAPRLMLSSSPNAPGKLPGTDSFDFFSSTGKRSFWRRT